MNELDMLEGGHVEIWHPYRDKGGMTRVPVYLREKSIYGLATEPYFSLSSLDDLSMLIGKNMLFCLCDDILDTDTFPYLNEMLFTHTPYLCRKGTVPALRIQHKRKSGYLVQASTWLWHDQPSKLLLEDVTAIFQLFCFMATTPSSLSERVLRASLPPTLCLSRPSRSLRDDTLENYTGGRIDKAEYGRFYRKVKEFDIIKAYLSESVYVPDPSLSPIYKYMPPLEEIFEYPAGWWKVKLIAHTRGRIAPIHIKGRPPRDNEQVTVWLWTFEIQDCLEAGYTIVAIERGYAFRGMSGFMQAWVDILYTNYEYAQHNLSEHAQKIIKQMMVGLPGRFLRQPETYELIPIEQAEKGDIALHLHWSSTSNVFFSDYAIRPVYDPKSTALCQIGNYIVARTRHKLYLAMRAEEQAGNEVIRSYVDCYAVNCSEIDYNEGGRDVGGNYGQWRIKEYADVWAEENRFIGYSVYASTLEARLPGLSLDARVAYLQKYAQEGFGYASTPDV